MEVFIAMIDLRPGNTVYGQTEQETFEITRFIGAGSFGSVYEVIDTQGQKHALKTISTAPLNNTALEALLNEGRLATEIQHPNVLRVLFFHDGQQYPNLPPYMISEYADEGTLQDLLDRQRASGTTFNSEELRAIFLKLAEGMRAINEKLVHRDIKPDNILRNGDQLKIADFGLSKVVGAATRTQTFKGINHIMYCAPEAWRSEQNAPSMDMYSMGITFFEIATLRGPYDVTPGGDWFEAWKNAHFFAAAHDPAVLNPTLDIGLAQTILKMIAKDPKDRFASWDEVIDRLRASSSQTTRSRDVSSLVSHALEGHRQAEKARLEAEQEAASGREHWNFVRYSFGKIIEAARETIEAFNEASEFVKLRLGDSPNVLGLGFIIEANGVRGNHGYVHVYVTAVFDEHELDGRRIKAWGWAKAPSKRGFNLILVSRDADDLYGQWLTLHVQHNFMYQEAKDQRPEPFPFEDHELPREILLLRALHIYRTKLGDFQPQLLDPLIQELL
ncbi:MAG: eukaryotic-like serine/threonine-protein kinase [Chloroflexia bacterium]|jgi:serine/threonine protein kinase|nr:eukaryotic-like serine/threonine-protein kinase [Chloroflexia bacterium]